jgi:HD-GYP domain-containing protein (c-di-GMP phosphodiesterase class II)
MTTTRPYRPAMEPPAAAAELVRCSGTQFDPAVVEALLAVVEVAPGESLIAA